MSTNASMVDSTAPALMPTDDVNPSANEPESPCKNYGIDDLRQESEEENDASNNIQSRGQKRKTSKVWEDFEQNIVDSISFAICKHCKTKLSMGKSKQTTSLKRHLSTCQAKKAKVSKEAQQKKLTFKAPDSVSLARSSLYSGAFDQVKARMLVANWILTDENPFAVVESDSFNMMLKGFWSEWNPISRFTVKEDCAQMYEAEKSCLKNLLKKVRKISITTDLWKSKNKKIEYMVVTSHWIDENWNLQKRVLNFIDIPPPRRGIEIASSIFKCAKEWGIENKIHTISVDNASNNDVAIRILKEDIGRAKRLLGDGKLFHVRCDAHIMNLMVQDGLSEIRDICEKIRDSVDYINRTDGRMLMFADLAQQLQVPRRKLIHDCRTRWNSTFEMLKCALKFRAVFLRFQENDGIFDMCPSEQDWNNVEKVCIVLEPFSKATQVLSGSDYPTSNLLLPQVLKIKKMLDAQMKNDDVFVKEMVTKMKLKFDKYWGECNLLMEIASVLDPRRKMKWLKFAFSTMLLPLEASRRLELVHSLLSDLYEEYVVISTNSESISTAASSTQSTKQQPSEDWGDFDDFNEEDSISQNHSELIDYLSKPYSLMDQDQMDLNLIVWLGGS